MTMTGRFVDHGIRILAAVAVLAVMSSPSADPSIPYSLLSQVPLAQLRHPQ